MEENNDEKKKTHKISLFNKVIIGLVLATILYYLFSIPSTIKSRKLSEQAINVVKEMRIVEDSDMTIGEAFDKYFSDIKWYTHEDDNKFDVIFSGYGMFDGKEQYTYCRFTSQNAEHNLDYVFVGDEENLFVPGWAQPDGNRVYSADYAREEFLRTIAESVKE